MLKGKVDFGAVSRWLSELMKPKAPPLVGVDISSSYVNLQKELDLLREEKVQEAEHTNQEPGAVRIMQLHCQEKESEGAFHRS